MNINAQRNPVNESIYPLYYQLRISLLNTDPLVWRQILVPRDILLSHLHSVIQNVMGWDDDHLHEYVIGKKHYAKPGRDRFGFREPPVNEEIVRLNGVAKPNAKFSYIYDFGDNWIHEINIESEIQGSSVNRIAQCIQGANACPPEDCGGVFGYSNMLSILRDLNHEEYKHIREWVGEEFDPCKFDLHQANGRLSRISV